MSNNPEVIAPQRRPVTEHVSDIKESLSSIAHIEGDRVRSVLERGKERVKTLQTNSREYVRENPVRSVLIAAGVGVALGYLLGRRRS